MPFWAWFMRKNPPASPKRYEACERQREKPGYTRALGSTRTAADGTSAAPPPRLGFSARVRGTLSRFRRKDAA